MDPKKYRTRNSIFFLNYFMVQSRKTIQKIDNPPVER